MNSVRKPAHRQTISEIPMIAHSKKVGSAIALIIILGAKSRGKKSKGQVDLRRSVLPYMRDEPEEEAGECVI